jgi:hypothetical protein
MNKNMVNVLSNLSTAMWHAFIKDKKAHAYANYPIWILIWWSITNGEQLEHCWKVTSKE